MGNNNSESVFEKNNNNSEILKFDNSDIKLAKNSEKSKGLKLSKSQ